jgi:hypothetical protein
VFVLTALRVSKWGVAVIAVVVAGSVSIAQPPPSPQEADKSRSGVVTTGKTQPKEDANQRTIEGIVTDAAHNPLARAIVQLKDTRTLQIRSFVTQADGTYRFGGLRMDVDYELKAVVGEQSTPTKRVSSFESRKVVPLNLALEKK